jgi:hypothetical protein
VTERLPAGFQPWGPNCAHTDGEAYGDRFPPFLFLLFAHQSDEVRAHTAGTHCHRLPHPRSWRGWASALAAARSTDKNAPRDPSLARAHAQGGENALVDSRFVFEQIERELPELGRRLRTVPVDQTQYHLRVRIIMIRTLDW